MDPQDIHYEFINQLPNKTLQMFFKIYNYIWRNGNFTEMWIQSFIIPIPNPGKYKKDAENFRPIVF